MPKLPYQPELLMASEEVQTKRILKKLEKNHEDWRKTMMELYANGASDREVLVALKLSPGAWKVLEGNTLDSDFLELVTLGRIWAQAWWEKMGRTNLMTAKFNTSLWGLQMKNRFGWSEKSEVSQTDLDMSNKDDATLAREIEELQKQLDRGRGKTTV